MKRFMNISKKHSSVCIAMLLALASCDSNGSNINEYTVDMLNCNKETNNCYDKKSNKPITGLVKEYYDNSGKHIKSEITYKDGLLNGSKKLYYIDGKTKLETNFVDGISGSCPNYCLNIKDEYERIASASYCPMIKNEGKPLAQMMNKEYQKVEQKYWDEMKKHCPPSLCDYSDFQLDPFRFCHF